MAVKKNQTAPKSFTSSLRERLSERSTWLGLLTLGASLATGDLASWLNTGTIPTVTSALGLIVLKEGE